MSMSAQLSFECLQALLNAFRLVLELKETDLVTGVGRMKTPNFDDTLKTFLSDRHSHLADLFLAGLKTKIGSLRASTVAALYIMAGGKGGSNMPKRLTRENVVNAWYKKLGVRKPVV